MARSWLAVPLSLTMFVSACSDRDEEAIAGSPNEDVADRPESLEPFAEVLGCDSWTDAISDGGLGSAVGHSCVVEGNPVAWVHRFQPSDRSLLLQHWEQRSPSDNLDGTVCADGKPPSNVGPWILVGDDWATSSYHEDLVAQVAETLGGEYAGGGGDGEEPPTGPPASFQVPDFCADGLEQPT